MITTVYALTREITGPPGHGEPGTPCLSLLTDGEWYNLGNPLPLFTTKEQADKFVKDNKLSSVEVIPLELRG